MIYPDANIANADWPKQTWDLPIDPAAWETVPLEQLRQLVTVPAWDAAPDEVRAVVDRRLADE